MTSRSSHRHARAFLGVAFCVAATVAVPLRGQTLESVVRTRLDSLNAESAFYAKQLSTGREIAAPTSQ